MNLWTRVWRVSPLLFVLDGIGGIQLSAIPGRWLDSIYRPYFGLHPQGFAVSSASRATSAFRHHGMCAGAVSFLCQSQSSRPTPKEGVCVSRGGGTFHTGEGFASGSRPSTLAPGPHKGGYYKSLCERTMENRGGQESEDPAQSSGSLDLPDGEVVEADGDVPPAADGGSGDQPHVSFGEAIVDVVGHLLSVGIEG
jgi:hypothetical protein